MDDQKPNNKNDAGGAERQSIIHVGDVLRAVHKAFEPGSALNKRIQEQMQPVLQAMQLVQPYLDGLNELARRTQPAILALQRLEEQYRPHMLAIAEGMRRFEEFNAGLVERHKNETLALPPFFNEITLPDLYEIFKEREKPALEIYREFFADREHVKLLLESWSENRFYEDRKPILRDALDAHLEGKHTLSIPAFLAQVEGILCEIFDVRDHGKVKGKLNKVQFKTEENHKLFANAELIARIITDQVFHSSDDDQQADYPSRHRVLHGSNPFYYRDKNASLRCILLLDLLRSEKFLALNEKNVASGESETT